MGAAKGTLLDLGLPSFPETRDPAIFQELSRVYSALNTLAFAVEAYTGVADVPKEEWSTTGPASTILLQNMSKIYVQAGEAIAAGLMVSMFVDTDTKWKARIARAESAQKYRAIGFVSSASVAIGEFCEVTLMGLSPFYTGLLPNRIYYLGSNGLATNTIPAQPNLQQAIGVAVTDTLMFFNPSLYMS